MAEVGVKDVAHQFVARGVSLQEAEEVFRAALIEAAIEQAGTVSGAARRLGVHRNTIHEARKR